MNKYARISLDGIINNNPTFKLVLGTCSTLALTTSAINGIGMGLTVTVILIFANALIASMRKLIPAMVRIPCYVVIIATLVTIVRMLLYKFLPDLYDSMGIFLPLIVVNCVLLGRAEAFASKNPVIDSAVDGFANGIGLTAAFLVMSVIREFLGGGAFFGMEIIDFKIGFFSSPAGAFFVYGICIALFVFVSEKIHKNIRKVQINRELSSGKYLLGKEAD